VPECFFVSDLHGRKDRYLSLFNAVVRERPAALFLGGDLLPHIHRSLDTTGSGHDSFVRDFLAHHLSRLREQLMEEYPRIFVILGNDDVRSEERQVEEVAAQGLWEYVHCRKSFFGDFQVYGYSYVPPTPFLLKDWERFDVSRYVDPGCVSPEDGHRSVEIPEDEKRYSTISDDLERLVGQDDLRNSLILFHAPPYHTALDRAALDGKAVEHAPLDVHIGSIAVQRFIEKCQPLLTLHGHVHESARITGSWKDRLGRTYCFSAAHDGPELALVRFDPARPEDAERELLAG
jgi:Icc-related predicted phosphoesterase